MRTIIAILVLALATARAALAGDARFLLPQDEAFEGSPIQVIVEVNDAAKVTAPTLPEIPGASVRVTERGRQSRTEIINGRMRNSTTVTYAVEIVPERPGMIEIPAIEVMVDGSPVRSQPKMIEVKRSDAGDLLSAEVFGQPPEVTIGQPLELVLRIAIKPYRDVAFGTLNEAQMWQLVDLAGSEWGIFEPEITELRQRNAAPRSQQEMRDGQRTYVFEVSRRTWPPKAGTPDLGTIRVRMTYPLALREVQSFFLDRQLTITQSRPLAVTATADGIAVLPLPEAGRPASFTGAVGAFSIAVTAKPTNVGVGDPVTLTLAITDVAGGANLETLQPPALAGDAALAKDFRVPNEAISGVVTGNTKRFTVTVRPLRAGTSAVPPIEFSSFDPKTRSYATARSQPVPITVVPGSQLDLSKIVSGGGAAAQAPEDATKLTAVEGGLVANLPVDPAMLRDDRSSLGLVAIVGLALPPAMAGAALAWRVNRARHERDCSLARRSSARRTADRRLREATDAASIAGAVTGFVEDATGRPKGTVTRGDLESALAAAGAGSALRERARELLSRCERARYAGGAAAIGDLSRDAAALVDALDAAGLRTKEPPDEADHPRHPRARHPALGRSATGGVRRRRRPHRRAARARAGGPRPRHRAPPHRSGREHGSLPRGGPRMAAGAGGRRRERSARIQPRQRVHGVRRPRPRDRRVPARRAHDAGQRRPRAQPRRGARRRRELVRPRRHDDARRLGRPLVAPRAPGVRTTLAWSCWLVFWGIVAARALSGARSPQGLAGAAWKTAFWTTLGGWLLVGGSLVADEALAASRQRAVLIEPNTVLRKGNGDGFEPAFVETLGPGVEATVLEERPGWMRLELPDGRTGWVRANQAERG